MNPKPALDYVFNVVGAWAFLYSVYSSARQHAIAWYSYLWCPKLYAILHDRWIL